MTSNSNDGDKIFSDWKTNKLASLRYNRAICMLASGYTSQEVAKHLGVTQRSVQMWFKDSAFNDSLRYAINITFQSAVAKAADFADRAVDTLIKISEDVDTPAKYRIDAIKLLFDIVLKATTGNSNTPENYRNFKLRENLATLNQYASVQNIIETQNISLEKPSLGSLNIEQMKILWTILYPDEPYPEDDNDLRNWYENGNM